MQSNLIPHSSETNASTMSKIKVIKISIFTGLICSGGRFLTEIASAIIPTIAAAKDNKNIKNKDTTLLRKSGEVINAYPIKNKISELRTAFEVFIKYTFLSF